MLSAASFTVYVILVMPRLNVAPGVFGVGTRLTTALLSEAAGVAQVTTAVATPLSVPCTILLGQLTEGFSVSSTMTSKVQVCNKQCEGGIWDALEGKPLRGSQKQGNGRLEGVAKVVGGRSLLQMLFILALIVRTRAPGIMQPWRGAMMSGFQITSMILTSSQTNSVLLNSVRDNVSWRGGGGFFNASLGGANWKW